MSLFDLFTSGETGSAETFSGMSAELFDIARQAVTSRRQRRAYGEHLVERSLVSGQRISLVEHIAQVTPVQELQPTPVQQPVAEQPVAPTLTVEASMPAQTTTALEDLQAAATARGLNAVEKNL
jgi:hypothetical protein